MTKHLMEAICAPDNIAAAMRAVVRNKGAAGVDRMTIRDLPSVFAAHWPEIERDLLEGRYQQQAVLQRLQPMWDPTFSEHSYGFRPGRSAHQAVAQAQAYVIDGYQFVVDF